MFKFFLFFGLAACAYPDPLLITSGTFSLYSSEAVFSFVGDGFSLSAMHDDGVSPGCPLCPAPYPLTAPLFSPIFAQDGQLTFGQKSYVIPHPVSFMGQSPWAEGTVFLAPQGVMPTVPGAGTYDVPFNVEGSFCVTDNGSVPPPFFDPGNPACFSFIGAAIAHYKVTEAINAPNLFFQALPTIEIVSTPEPGTLGAGMFGVLLILAAKRFRRLHSRDTRQAGRHLESAE